MIPTITDEYLNHVINWARAVVASKAAAVADAWSVGEDCECMMNELGHLYLLVDAIADYNVAEGNNCLTLPDLKILLQKMVMITGPVPAIVPMVTAASTKRWIFWGSLPVNTSPSDEDILSLDGAGVGIGRALSNNLNYIFDGIDGGGDYLIFAFPTSFGSAIFISGGLEVNAYTKIRSNSPFTNHLGETINYDVWVGDTRQNSSIDSLKTQKDV